MNTLSRLCTALAFGAAILVSVQADAEPFKIVAFGDSGVNGSGRSMHTGTVGGVSRDKAYPAQIEKLLKAKGWDVVVVNEGVPGETSGEGKARVDKAVPAGTKLTVIQFGFNDLKRQVPKSAIAANIKFMVDRVTAKGSDYIVAFTWSPRGEPGFRFLREGGKFALWGKSCVDPSKNPLRPGGRMIAKCDSGDHEHFNAFGESVVAADAVAQIEPLLEKLGATKVK